MYNQSSRLGNLISIEFLCRSLCLILFLFAGIANAQIIRVANPNALPVVDNAKILTPEQISKLNVDLRTLADTDGTQVVVLTLPTTGDEDIFTFAQRTFKDWGIGQGDNNNGVLFVIAKGDRKVRIHPGYGMEGTLTDALSKRIIEQEITPEFRKDNYYQGINNGVQAIIKTVRGEYEAPIQKNPSGGSDLIVWLIVIAFFIFIFMKSRGRGGPGSGMRRGSTGLPNIWTTGGSSAGGWGHSSGDSGGGSSGGFSGGFGGGSSGGGGASGSW